MQVYLFQEREHGQQQSPRAFTHGSLSQAGCSPTHFPKKNTISPIPPYRLQFSGCMRKMTDSSCKRSKIERRSKSSLVGSSCCAYTCKHIQTHTQTLTNIHSQSHTHTITHSQTHTHNHTLTNTLTHTNTRSNVGFNGA